jgi:Holliday junction resolvase
VTGGRSSRTKGSNAEREVVNILRESGYDCHRIPTSGALSWMKGDVTGTGFHIEVKRCEALRISEWCAKAEAEAGEKHSLLIFRRSREPWRVCLTLEAFIKLMEEK